MIKFFRRIRQRLLTEDRVNSSTGKPASRTGRYLLYAIGEIFLVVIGILIALQVNNWNQEKKNKITEVALLEQLEKDLTNSLGDIEFNINLIDKGIQSSEFLLHYMNTDQPYNDSLASHFASAFPWTRLMISLGTYETIKSHGIEIISNHELRDKLVNAFENRLYFQRQLENVTQDYAENMRRSGFVKSFKSTYVDFGLNGEYDVGKSIPKDYRALKKDEEFRYHLESFMSLLKLLQNYGNRPIQKSIEELIDAIQIEISKH